ncbi:MULTISPECIES: hypothetical protein [unclassified Rathayibacter]|uniref:hypothetical protein n=1 Tax=unclassified Rathayibacter TaxID=2609250 RepID=UPI0010514060|nr:MULTISPECIES: hypothetical protein [unclassified Rathayibacter]TCL84699.1 hypothetical protein EDF49_102368 [Rathayibacter sp. PhB192]TCM30417.1 hypothetical protein EDF43_102368 [Rathayibacter sp. PhB179]
MGAGSTDVGDDGNHEHTAQATGERPFGEPGHADARTTHDGPPRFPLSLVVVVPVGMLVLGGLFGSVLALSTPWLPMALTRAGLPYAVLALIVAVALRLSAVRAVRADRSQPLDAVIASGRSLAQRATRATAATLLAIWLIVATAFALQTEPGLLVLAGGPVIIGALLSIVANAPLLYSPRIARSEVAVVLAHADGRRRILANWILAPLSWFAYAIPVQALGLWSA